MRRSRVLPGFGKQFDMLGVQLDLLVFRPRFPRAVLAKHERILEDAAANHDTVELVLSASSKPCARVMTSPLPTMSVSGTSSSRSSRMWATGFPIGWRAAHIFFGAAVDGKHLKVLPEQAFVPRVINRIEAETRFDAYGNFARRAGLCGLDNFHRKISIVHQRHAGAALHHRFHRAAHVQINAGKTQLDELARRLIKILRHESPQLRDERPLGR